MFFSQFFFSEKLACATLSSGSRKDVTLTRGHCSQKQPWRCHKRQKGGQWICQTNATMVRTPTRTLEQ